MTRDPLRLLALGLVALVSACADAAPDPSLISATERQLVRAALLTFPGPGPMVAVVDSAFAHVTEFGTLQIRRTGDATHDIFGGTPLPTSSHTLRAVGFTADLDVTSAAIGPFTAKWTGVLAWHLGAAGVDTLLFLIAADTAPGSYALHSFDPVTGAGAEVITYDGAQYAFFGSYSGTATVNAASFGAPQTLSATALMRSVAAGHLSGQGSFQAVNLVIVRNTVAFDFLAGIPAVKIVMRGAIP